MDEQRVRDLVEHFYRGFLAADREGLVEVLHRRRPGSSRSALSATSAWHGVIMDRFLAERGEQHLDSHEAVIVAVEQSRIVRIFHYLHDPAGFAAFWSR